MASVLRLVTSNPVPLSVPVRPLFIIHCPHCACPISATTEGKAMQMLAAHLVWEFRRRNCQPTENGAA